MTGSIVTAEQVRFDELARRWKDETGFMSNLTMKWAHPAHMEIIAMGQPALPLILAELERESDHWFFALMTLADKDVAVGEQTVEGARQKWLAWGREQGYLD